jgi:hypothetical protein
MTGSNEKGKFAPEEGAPSREARSIDRRSGGNSSPVTALPATTGNRKRALLI